MLYLNEERRHILLYGISFCKKRCRVVERCEFGEYLKR